MLGFGRNPKTQSEGKGWSVSDPGPEIFALFGAGLPTVEGEPQVGAEGALRVPAVAACVRTIAETVASLDLRVKTVDGVDAEHPVSDLLARPNPWTSAFAFKRDLVFDAIQHGTGYAVAVRAGGMARELHRGYPGTIAAEIDLATGEPRYRLNAGTAPERILGWSDVVAVQPIPSRGDGAAPSLLTLAADSVGFATNLNRHGRRLFANGARPGGLLKFAGRLSKETAQRWREAVQAQTGGGNAGRPMVLGEDATWTPFGFSSTDAQFLELSKFTILEIARVFKVPPHMLADLERTSHSNAEELNLQFVALCLRPWCELICGALQRVVFDEDQQLTHWLEFDFGDLLRPNTQQLFEAVTKAVGGPTLTPDEGRAIAHGLGKIPGGDKLNAPQGVASAPPSPPGPTPPPLRSVA